MKRVGIDIGGTFTDIVVFDEETGALSRSKTPSVPHAPEEGFMAALKLAKASPEDISTLVHGTTIVTNLILERKGARVALITTKGFRDVLEIMRATRPLPYDLQWLKPTPLIPRELCFEVDERLMASGAVAKPIDRADVERVVRAVLAQGVEGVAVCLLHAYRDDAHELLVGEVVRQLAPDLPLSLSSAICREIREYERANTTAANVYAMPRVRRYVAALRAEVGERVVVNYLSSEGGVQPGAEAAERPISLGVSGPAGGVLGGVFLGELTGRRNLITADMGGTSFDVAVIRDGKFELKNSFEIAWGLPVKTPTIDIKTIGAGGGSIVWVDEGGALQVGPQSAGAVPGPACYGAGGTACTVTDANLVLGLIREDGLMPLQRDLAVAAVQTIADRFGTSVEDTAEGIYRVVNASMASAIRTMTVEKGIDPRDFALAPFGGAGGQHAAALARDVGIPEIIVPPMASVFSAFGMVSAPVKISRARTLMAALDELDWGQLVALFEALRSEIAAVDHGVKGGGEPSFRYSLDMKYSKQAHEIAVAIEPDWTPAQVVDAFEARHFELYGTKLGHKTTIVTARLTAVASLPPLRPTAGRERPGRPRQTVRTARVAGVREPVGVYDRTALWPGARVDGPCLVEEFDTSFFVPPGASARVDAYGDLIVTLDASQEPRHGA